MTRSEGKQCKSWVIQTIHVHEPPSHSAATLVLLAKKYFALDKSIYTERRMHKLRNKWMRLQMKTSMDDMGGLTCAICGRKGLLPFSDDQKKIAVLDHIVEIGQKGSWNDPINFQVACYRCNDQKNERLQKRLRRGLTFAM